MSESSLKRPTVLQNVHQIQRWDPTQRGRGIGGLFRAVSSLFKPMVKTLGSTALKAARSSTGKLIGNALKEQAISSAINLTADAIRGNDLKESLQNEVGATREKIGDAVANISSMKRKQKTFPAKSHKKMKRHNLRVSTAKNVPRGYASYIDNKARDILMD